MPGVCAYFSKHLVLSIAREMVAVGFVLFSWNDFCAVINSCN